MREGRKDPGFSSPRQCKYWQIGKHQHGSEPGSPCLLLFHFLKKNVSDTFKKKSWTSVQWVSLTEKFQTPIDLLPEWVDTVVLNVVNVHEVIFAPFVTGLVAPRNRLADAQNASDPKFP